MAETVNGKIEVDLVTKGEDEKGAEGGAPKADAGKKKDDPQIGGIGKQVGGFMKMMKKVNPVFDVSNIIVSLLRKSQVIMAIIEPFIDILMAFVDTLLAQFVPLFVPILKILAGLLPEFQILVSWIQPFLEPITSTLDTLAKWVTEGAKILKSLADKFQLGQKVGKFIGENLTGPGLIKKGIGGVKSLLGFQSGTKYVPQNMTAELHRGESVLTARETQMRNSAKNNPALTVQNPQFTINAGGATAMDAKVFGSMLYREFAKKLTDEARRA
jgi:hypothetical protein